MTIDRTTPYLLGLLNELRKLPKEVEWVEFKRSYAEPVEIGEYISALANSAALAGKVTAYLVWGVDDTTHDIVGTSFVPSKEKIGNEELENWLLRSLTPKIPFHFHVMQAEEKMVVLLEIGRAFRHPVQFQHQEFIRVGSYKKKLKEFSEKERELWRIFDETPFESHIAAQNLPAEDVLRLLDYPAYFDLLEIPLPEARQGVLLAMEADKMIAPSGAGHWDITNLGAILFAKRLADFHEIKRKAIRVVVYKGNNRLETLREQIGVKGYAVGFEGVIAFINGLLPSNEVIGQALRKDVPMYPELAIRELVANALIHQDLFVTGAGPMVEIFADRMEITNPGVPLVDTNRFLDSPPRSRNEALASFMRRIGVCEERGSGVDKVVFQSEFYQLPAPLFEVSGENTRAVLFAHKPFARMDKADRVRACYLHACLQYVNRDPMTNASLRARFGIQPGNLATASRIIRDTVQAQQIRLLDPDQSRKYSKYVPFWA